jgi:hypothetical protein
VLVLLYLALLDERLVATASVTRHVERVSVVRAYSALVLMISVQRFLLHSVLLALLIELTEHLLALLGYATEILYQRVTVE